MIVVHIDAVVNKLATMIVTINMIVVIIIQFDINLFNVSSVFLLLLIHNICLCVFVHMSEIYTIITYKGKYRNVLERAACMSCM